jgi:predicted SnoaL-like aldol condensation-catalyzing enzyme
MPAILPPEGNVMRVLLQIAVAACLGAPIYVTAQEAVVPAKDADALFTAKDPKLNANKQVAYHIMKDLLEANHWELADRYIAPEYHQHNPLVASGRDTVVNFFVQVLHRQPTPIPAHMKTPVVSVLADGDLVVVTTPLTLKDPRDPSQTYTSTWFDMWRIENGKATEHWDGATKGMAPPAP